MVKEIQTDLLGVVEFTAIRKYGLRVWDVYRLGVYTDTLFNRTLAEMCREMKRYAPDSKVHFIR